MGLLGLSDSETIRLWKELGGIAEGQKAFDKRLTEHIEEDREHRREDREARRELKQALRDLGAEVEETGKHELAATRAKARELEIEKRRDSAAQTKAQEAKLAVRRATISKILLMFVSALLALATREAIRYVGSDASAKPREAPVAK